MTRAGILRGLSMAMTLQNVTGGTEGKRTPTLKLAFDRMTLPGGKVIEQMLPVSDRICGIANFAETDGAATTASAANAFVRDVFSARLGLTEWVWKRYVPILRSDAYAWVKETVSTVFPLTAELGGSNTRSAVQILDSTVTVPAADYGAAKGTADSGYACTFSYPALPVGVFSTYSGHNRSNDYAFIHLLVYRESAFSKEGIFQIRSGEDFQYSEIGITFSPRTGTQFSLTNISWQALWPGYDPAQWSSMKYYNGKKITIEERYEV